MAKLPKFIKIVANPEEQKLKIPTEFTRRHGHKLPNIIFLKVPTGSSWKVELKRTGNEIWLGKGWQEFKEHYLIDIAYFLFFEYQGNAEFKVVICDITASEIEYSLHDANQGSEIEEITGSESHDSDVIFVEEISTAKAAKTGKCITDSGNQSLKIGAKGVDKKTCLAYQRAKNFKSDNPFYIAIMHPSYVSGYQNLSIPLSIAKANLPHRHNNLELRVGNRKTWTVSCNISTQNAKINSVGWKNFVDENKLEVGDVCIFEVMKRKELVWNVIIFRN